jgi:hypothetical protein
LVRFRFFKNGQNFGLLLILGAHRLQVALDAITSELAKLGVNLLVTLASIAIGLA